MRVAFLDLVAAYRELADEIDAVVAQVLVSGSYVLSPEVDAFEQEFAAYCGTEYCVGVGSGLDALTLALLAVGVGPGDEVIVPANTFIATWLAVSRCGAIPVAVDPPQGAANIDPGGIAAAITGRTKAILPVHLYGIPLDIKPIAAMADRYGLALVEDAAQAHGARLAGVPVGAGERLACWSFYPGKNLGGVGDAGAVTTGDPALAERIRRLRNYGSLRKYHFEEMGFNSRLDPLQAAVLRVKLRRLDEWNRRRRDLAAAYVRLLHGLSLHQPVHPLEADSSWHLFVVWHERRDFLQQTLLAEGIETMIHYPVPPHLQPAYRALGLKPGAYPVAERQAAEALSLPIGPHLEPAQMEYVAAKIHECLS